MNRKFIKMQISVILSLVHIGAVAQPGLHVEQGQGNSYTIPGYLWIGDTSQAFLSIDNYGIQLQNPDLIGLQLNPNGGRIRALSSGTGSFSIGHSFDGFHFYPGSTRIGLGTNSPESTLHINKYEDIDSGNGGLIRLGNWYNNYLLIDNNEIQTYNRDQTSFLYLNVEGGNVAIGNALPPRSTLHIGTGEDAALHKNGYLMLGDINGPNIILDNNEIMARNDGQASPLYLNNDGGALFAGGLRHIGDQKNMQYNSSTGEIGYDNSSRRYKNDISRFQDDWEKLFQTRPVTYTRTANPNHWEIGYIAEEIDSLGLTNLVGYDAEGLPDDVKYDRMVLYLTEIIKTLKKQVDQLDEKILVLEKQKCPRQKKKNQ